MTREEKQAVLHCLRSMIDEEVCEECPLYGTTGTDHCEKDCVRLAIKSLEQEPILDKIMAEIEQMPSELTADGRRMIRRGSVFRIIEKYKAGGTI